MDFAVNVRVTYVSGGCVNPRLNPHRQSPISLFFAYLRRRVHVQRQRLPLPPQRQAAPLVLVVVPRGRPTQLRTGPFCLAEPLPVRRFFWVFWVCLFCLGQLDDGSLGFGSMSIDVEGCGILPTYSSCVSSVLMREVPVVCVHVGNRPTPRRQKPQHLDARSQTNTLHNEKEKPPNARTLSPGHVALVAGHEQGRAVLHRRVRQQIVQESAHGLGRGNKG